jgi:hypothetical protein
MREIRTSVDIDTDPSVVWDILSGFALYPEWNPFVRSISGTLSVGEALEVMVGASGNKPMRFTPVVTSATPSGEMAWLGHFGTKGIFDGHHHFRLTQTTTGTHLDHFEEFSGVLSPILVASIRKSTTRGFDEMNRALKQRAEENVA